MGVNALVKKVLVEVGFKPERFNLQWASAAEAPRFVKLITDFTRQIQEIGPLGEAEGFNPGQIKQKLEDALELVSSRKLRVSFGNLTKNSRKEGAFTQEFISNLVDEKMTDPISSGLIEAGLITALKGSKSPVAVSALAKQTGTSTEQIEKLLTTWLKQEKVKQSGKKWALIEK